jgi:phage shock protein A
MPELSEQLRQLRPVIFHYKTDPQSLRQYGLIAEEVDKVYPELVIRDGKGVIQGVRYEELAPMLLNEVQKQQAELHAQHEVMETQTAQIETLKKLVGNLQAGLESLQSKQAKLETLKTKDERVARLDNQ